MIYTIIWQVFGAIALAAVVSLAVMGFMKKSEGMEDEDSHGKSAACTRPESRVAK